MHKARGKSWDERTRNELKRKFFRVSKWEKRLLRCSNRKTGIDRWESLMKKNAEFRSSGDRRSNCINFDDKINKSLTRREGKFNVWVKWRNQYNYKGPVGDHIGGEGVALENWSARKAVRSVKSCSMFIKAGQWW